MAIPFAALAFGSLLGGGSTEQNTSVTTSQSLVNAFNPVSTVNVGGAVEAAPSGGASGSSDAAASVASGRQPTSAFPSIGLGGYGGDPGDYSAGIPIGGADSLLSNPIVLIGGAVAAYFLIKG